MNKLGVLVVNTIHGDMIREENYQGEPHYMIASATMPDDIVMNGLLYPAEEIEASYMGLNGVHAPLGHPVGEDGDFISASTPYAIRNYGVGAQVANVRRENGRILHDTAINIAVAKETDRGKRLLDRIEAMKNGDNTKPIHTSTGIYLKKRDLPEPQTNQYGEYYGIASDYVYDHNAILLDEIGAATPSEGTGMFVNANGHQVPVFVMNMDGEMEGEKEEEVELKVPLSFFKKFMKMMGFAPSIDAAYNSGVNTKTNEGLEMTPEELKAALAEQATALQANFKESLASAVQPLEERMATLETNAQAAEKAEKEALAEKLGLEADEVAGMSVNTLQKMAAKLESQDTGEYGERAPVFGANQSKQEKDEWEGYDLNANMEAK